MSTLRNKIVEIPENYKILMAAIIGSIIPICCWIVTLFNLNQGFNFDSISEIHKNNFPLWFLDILPFIFAAVLSFIYQQQKIKRSILDTIIEEKEQVISRNIALAKKIGNGDFNYQNSNIDRNDVLSQSLLRMQQNLIINHQKEEEQNWISAGKDLISNILRLHNNLNELTYEVLVELIKYLEVIQGAIYIYEDEKIINYATYGYSRRKYLNQEFNVGEGLIGECAFEMDIVYRTEIPEDYAFITSGILGDKKPASILIVPLVSDEKLQGVIEFASLDDTISELKIKFMKEIGEIIARTIYNLRINQKTSELLKESQVMTEELKQREEELRQNAEEMRATHEELEIANSDLGRQMANVAKAQNRQHTLLENASEIIFIYSDKKLLKYISPSVTKILGFTPEEMTNGKDTERLSHAGEQMFNKMFNKLLENPKERQTIQYTFTKKDGTTISLEATGRNMLHDPSIEGIILNSQDITDRINREKEERMKSKMQSLSENSNDMIIRINTSGQFFYANPITEKYLGIKANSLTGQTLNSVKLNEDLKNFFKETIKITKEEKIKKSTELTFTTPNNEQLIVSIDSIPEFNENELETILFVSHDITKAKEIEEEIKDANRNMSESINYAERIQSSILPNNYMIQSNFTDSFILYKPRDIVSGDFPWYFEKDGIINIAAVDCTGHGVPGALLSFIGYFLLNNIVDASGNLPASEIIDRLHFEVRRTLKQDHIDSDARDGMDIAFVQIDKENSIINYAGAHRPLYLVRDGELIEYKGDRKAIGGIPHRKKAEVNFTNHRIEYKKGDRIYFFSDGLPDQIGGPEKKKYTAKRIREIVVDNNNYSMKQLHNIFEADYLEWKDEYKQIDDILLLGIEL